jgi:hypothetical protein
LVLNAKTWEDLAARWSLIQCIFCQLKIFKIHEFWIGQDVKVD